MDKGSITAVDNFLVNWNGLFPDMPLAIADLKKPHAVCGALFVIFDRLGISRDAVMMSPEEPDEHTPYYRDLLPVINITRIINHVVSIMPEANLSIPITHLLQPTTLMSYTILMVLFNLMVFNESRLEDIAPREEELFAYQDQVKLLTEKKDDLIHKRNTEAAEKGKRKERLEQLEVEIPQLEEELKREQEIEAEVLAELEAINEENRQAEILLEQKRAQRDAILAENARKKALRVYDADDIKSQAEQAAVNVKQAEEKLSALSATLTQKESCLNNLQTLKPMLDQTNTLLHDIMKVADCIRDFENGDLDADSVEGELAVLRTEASELEAALGEAAAAAARGGARRRERQGTRLRERSELESALHDTEERVKRSAEEAAKAAALTRNIKEGTLRYEQEKLAGMAEIAAMKDCAVKKLTTMQDNLLNKMKDVSKRVDEQSQRRRKL